MQKLFLLDAYALIYRAYYGFIKNPRINSKGQNTSAVLGFVNTLEEVLTKENPDYIGVSFDPSGPTFRHEAYPAYKAQREETPEGIRFAIPYIKKILAAYRIPILEVLGFEADDVIGTLATQAGKLDEIDTFMMTPDKDYGQLVQEHVRMYKPRHDGGFDIIGIQEILDKYSIESPTQVIDLLALMGDSADNFPGCPGVGEKTAVKLIKEFGSTEQLIERSAELKGALKKKVEEHIEDIQISKFLARIKTDVPIELNLDSLKREPVNEEELKTIYEELEFRTLLNKRQGKSTSASNQKSYSSQKSQQPSLFSGDLFATPSSPSENGQNNQDIFATNPNESAGMNIFSNLSDLKSIEHKYYLIDNEEEQDNLIARLLTFEFLSLDTETTSVDPMSEIGRAHV